MADNLLVTISGGTATLNTQDNGGIHTQGIVVCNSSGAAQDVIPVSVSGDVEVTSHVKENLLVHGSTARTATPTAVENTNLYHDGVLIYFEVTAITSTPSVTPSLRVKDDAASGDWITLDTYAAVSTVSANTYYIHPNAPTVTPTFTDTTQVCLGRVWSLLMTHANANSITYTVGAIYL